MIAPLRTTLLITTFFLTASRVLAGTTNLSVDPLVAEVRVQPGGSATTETAITNNGDEPERITVRSIDWTTRLDGGISIEALGSEGHKSLTPYLQALTYNFVLQPHETRRLEVAASLPPTFPGAPASYWGGFYIKATALDQSNAAIGPAATFFVYNDVGTPRRHLSIESLRASGNRDTLRFTTLLKNDAQGYLRIGGTARLLQDGKTVRVTPLSIGAVFPGKARIVNGDFTDLPQGNYTLEVRFDYGSDVIVTGDTNTAVR
jgi:hypothetical protein